MGKLTIGLWTDWGMYFMKGPSEICKKMFPKSLTKKQYDRYCTLKQENKDADSFEMMGSGDKGLADKLAFLDESE